MVPVIGASGAIAGILGAYFILYPRGSILTFFPPFFFRLPAVLYLMVWFVVQLYGGIASGAAGGLAGGVAWWAHVGGFLFGVAAGPIAPSPPDRRRVARREQFSAAASSSFALEFRRLRPELLIVFKVLHGLRGICAPPTCPSPRAFPILDFSVTSARLE